MKVFSISTRGDSVPIARKLLSEGNDVNMFVRDRSFRKYLDPDIPLIKAPTIETVSSDLLLIEDGEAGKFADRARALHRLVIGGGTLADRLVEDIDFNERSMHGCGLILADEKTQGLLIEVGGWFDGEKYLRPHLIAFKYYRLGTGDVGPMTVGMGMGAKYIVKSRLFNDILRKTETLMKAAHYQGYAGVEGFINQESFRAIKLHAKLQFPIVNALGELHTTWSTFLVKLAKQEAEVVAVQPDRVVIGVNVLAQGYFDPNGSQPYKLYCGVGQNIEEAKSKAYKAVARAAGSNDYYRMDIGDSFSTSLSKLKEGSWL